MTATKRAEAETEGMASERVDVSRPEHPELRRMLNERQLLELIPISGTTLFRLMRAGKFPKSIYISPNRRIWFERDVVGWQQAIETVDQFNSTRGRGKGRRRPASV